MTFTRQELKADSPQMRGAIAFLAKVRDLGGMMKMEKILPQLTDAERAYLAPTTSDEAAVTITRREINGIEIELLEPKEGKQPGVLYYIHGGAFMYGDAKGSRPLGIDLAKATGLTVCTITYRLLPKHAFPAAVDDCTIVYRWLTEQFAGEPIVIAGDSAGGNLTMVMALEAKRLGLTMPSALVTYSLVGDFTGLPSWKENDSKDVALGGQHAGTGVAMMYCRLHKRSDPRISPNLGDLTGLPPIKIVVSTNELLYDDSIELADKASAAGVDVDLQIWDGGFHAFPSYPTAARDTPETAQVICETGEFITSVLTR